MVTGRVTEASVLQKSRTARGLRPRPALLLGEYQLRLMKVQIRELTLLCAKTAVDTNYAENRGNSQNS